MNATPYSTCHNTIPFISQISHTIQRTQLEVLPTGKTHTDRDTKGQSQMRIAVSTKHLKFIKVTKYTHIQSHDTKKEGRR